ncbi:MAG TPA: MBL fold metallo-hydrolase [Syntrophomonadaceae bacterium]|nr:MBL fold metallo-hydrolase [Syntrophomonadaceae bacterium]HPR94053.1 MBL fold metallo-hydrolase [Syntrophomonadaceae bacterium]
MQSITKNIKLLKAPQFKYPFCHCLLIEDELTCLVDSSPYETGKQYLNGRHIDMIVNTHGHQDHCLLNPDYPEANVYMHKNDHGMASCGENYLHELGFDLFKDEPVRAVFLSAIGYRSRMPDKSIEDGTIINSGTVLLETIYTPGHCAGHCAFLFPHYGFVFSGDIDLGTFPWYANLNSSVGDFLASINKLKKIKPEAIITGHGPGLVTKNISAQLDAYRDIILFRELEIVKLLAMGKNTIPELAAYLPIYKKLPQPERVFYLYECMMILKHLEHLIALDKVIFDNEKYYLNEGVKVHNIDIC